MDQRGAAGRSAPPALTVLDALPEPKPSGLCVGRRELQRRAWLWALAQRASDGALPTGSEIARQHDRRERWGRLVKNAGLAGEFAEQDPEQATGRALLTSST